MEVRFSISFFFEIRYNEKNEQKEPDKMITAIWAQDKNGLIGKDGLLPWKLPNDLNFFKSKTMKGTLVMGRKTYEGLGKRSKAYKKIYVCTRQNELPLYENAEIIHSPEEVLDVEDLHVGGGGDIFRLFLPYTDVIYRTLIDAEFTGDAYIGEIDFSDFELVEEIPGVLDEENIYPHVFQKWVRKPK